MQSATAYLVSDRVLVGTDSKTTAGLWIAQGPVHAFSMDDLAALGEGLATALDRSQEGVAHPAAWTGFFDPFLKVAKVRSLKQFMNGARCVGITRQNEEHRFEPTRNLGVKNGFEPLTAQALILSEGDISGIAKALIAAFQASE